VTAEHDRSDDRPPILSRKGYDEVSVFTPEALLREARRQKDMATGDVPEICILDPDGDIVAHLAASGSAGRHASWRATTPISMRSSVVAFGTALSVRRSARRSRPRRRAAFRFGLPAAHQHDFGRTDPTRSRTALLHSH
jgi:hypothetical protein